MISLSSEILSVINTCINSGFNRLMLNLVFLRDFKNAKIILMSAKFVFAQAFFMPYLCLMGVSSIT